MSNPTYPVVELLGDGIGSELAESVRQLAESCLPFRLAWRSVDLTLKNRRQRGEPLYDEAIEAMRSIGCGLKYPTVTAEESPNQVLRSRLDLSVIHRPVQTIPGIPTNFKAEVDLDIVRIATGGTYEDPGRMIGKQAAVSLRIVEREPCRQAATYAFELARRTHKSVTSASKHTIQRITDGLFESIVREVGAKYPDIKRRIELFDALLAKIVLKPAEYQIVLVLNEYGDFLSDMACGLVGSLGIGASGNYAFDAEGHVKIGMFDAAHGTAPDIAGQGKANPTAIFLALALMLYHLGEIRAGSAVKNACLDLLREGTRTPDLGGKCTTLEFTAAVAARAKERLEDPQWTSRTIQIHRQSGHP